MRSVLLVALWLAGCAGRVAPPPTVAPVAAAPSPAPPVPRQAAGEATGGARETVYNFEEDADPPDATGPQLDVVETGPPPAKFKPLLKDKYLRNQPPPPPPPGDIEKD